MTGKERVSFPNDPGSYLNDHQVFVAAVCFNDFFSGAKTKYSFMSKEYRAAMTPFEEWFKLIKANWQYSVISIRRTGEPWGIPGTAWAHIREEVVRIAKQVGILVIAAEWFFRELGRYKVMFPQSKWGLPGRMDMFHHSDDGNNGLVLTMDQYLL